MYFWGCSTFFISGNLNILYVYNSIRLRKKKLLDIKVTPYS